MTIENTFDRTLTKGICILDIKYSFNGETIISVIPSAVEIQDSIDYCFRFVTAILKDDGSIREGVPLSGNEVIEIQMSNDFTQTPRKMKFEILRIDEVPKEERKLGTATMLKLHLVEYPLYRILCGDKISRSWKQTKISDIIDELLKKYLPNYNVAIEPTATKIDFIIPRWTLLKTINYLLDLASTVNKTDRLDGTSFRFFSSQLPYGKITLDGSDVNLEKTWLNFCSAQNLMMRKDATYDLLLNYNNSNDGNSNYSIHQVRDYQLFQGDKTRFLTGLRGGSVLMYDFLENKYTEMKDKYSDNVKKLKTPDGKNNRMIYLNEGEMDISSDSSSFKLDRMYGSGDEYNGSKEMLTHKQLSDFNNNIYDNLKMKILSAGFEGRVPGTNINIVMPSTWNVGEWDDTTTGIYFVRAVKHIYEAYGQYYNVLECVKNSYFDHNDERLNTI